MAHVRRHTNNASPAPRQPPLIPDALRIRPSSTREIQRSQSFRVNDLPPYIGSPIQSIYQQQPNINNHSLLPPPRTGVFYNSINTKYDPLTGVFTNTTTTTTNPTENYQQPYIISSSVNRMTPRDRQLPRPPSSENLYSFTPQQYERPQLNNHETEEPVAIPSLTTDDGLPVVSLEKNHLPVFARFPFDVTFIPPPMDTNVEDNIHKLRLRLIDSELNRQRQSTNDYLKRTQNQLSLIPTKPTEHYVRNVRPPTNLTYQRVTSKVLTRQASYSPLSVDTPMTGGNFSGSSRDRIGMENEPQSNVDIEREFEVRHIQNSSNNGRRSNQQLMLSNYSYDPRLHLQPLNEEQQYSSSNMDDLIDSMARRHLAYRRLDATMDRQRHGNGGYGPYFESSALTRRASLRSQHRNDDLFLTNRTPSNFIEHDYLRTNPNDSNRILRSRGDYYNRFSPDLNGLGMNNILRTNSFSRLPPISPTMDSHRHSRSQLPTNSGLYHAKHHPQGYQNYQQSLPLNLPDHSEHLIELPSDIFLTSRAEPLDSSHHHHHHNRRSKTKFIPKDKSDASADSESDDEKKSSIVNRRKQKQDKHSANSHHGFFTEVDSEQQQQQQRKLKPRRHLFKKAAIGIYFIHILKHRVVKNRSNRHSQTLSATIHKIRLQEIMVALHRVYLEPDGPIYNALTQTITSSIELKDALYPSSKHHSEAINVIGEALKNIISRIVDFMPRDGVLGTAKNSAVAALIEDGNPFPENYFWQCEKELLEFNQSKIIHVTKQRAILLLIGVFIFRALVTTLLMKPIKYRLILGELSNTQINSLKVLASVMFYVGRRAAKSAPQILTLPHEWELSLYSDADIQPILEHSEIKSIINTCELSLRVWCEEYIHRIDGSFGKELRA